MRKTQTKADKPYTGDAPTGLRFPENSLFFDLQACRDRYLFPGGQDGCWPPALVCSLNVRSPVAKPGVFTGVEPSPSPLVGTEHFSLSSVTVFTRGLVSRVVSSSSALEGPLDTAANIGAARLWGTLTSKCCSLLSGKEAHGAQTIPSHALK